MLKDAINRYGELIKTISKKYNLSIQEIEKELCLGHDAYDNVEFNVNGKLVYVDLKELNELNNFIAYNIQE